MDAAERTLFADTVRQAITRHDDTDAALSEIGWRSALADDPPAATRIVFRLLGELNLASTAIDDVLTFALGLEPSDDRAVVLPALGGRAAPATYDRAELTISGLGTRRVANASQTLIVIDDGREQSFLTRLGPDALTQHSIEGIDPTAGWRSVEGTVKVSELKAVEWNDVIATGQLALAEQLAAGARAMLGLAREHATSRTQFDRPIASFQAVRHKLAESLVAVEAADAALEAGWADQTQFSAAMAKAIAGGAAKGVAKHAQQVLAGMGFTSEHAFHRYLKRTMILDQVLGSSASLRSDVGRHAITSKRIPPLLPL